MPFPSLHPTPCCGIAYETRVAKRMEKGTWKVPPSFSLLLFPFFPLPFFPPSPLDPWDTTHHSLGPRSVYQSASTVTWLTVAPLPPPPKGHTGCPYTRQVPVGVATPTHGEVNGKW